MGGSAFGRRLPAARADAPGLIVGVVRLPWLLLLAATLVAALALSLTHAAHAQSVSPAPLSNTSQAITTGNTYQQLLAASSVRKSITIENNNSADTCYIDPTGTVQPGDTTATSESIGGKTLTAIKGSIELLPGGAWTRYYPFIPSNTIVGTCASSSDSLYVDVQ